MSEMVVITFPDGETCQIPKGTTFRELWEKQQSGSPIPYEPMGAIFNQGQQCMMQEKVMQDGALTWIEPKSMEGYHVYRQSVLFILLKASYDLFPGRRMVIQHTISNAVFCEFKGMDIRDDEEKQLEKRMQEIIKADLPIHLCRKTGREAAEIFMRQGQEESAALMQLYPEEEVLLTELDGYYEYFFFQVTDHTGKLEQCRLAPYERGIILQTPEENAGQLMPFNEQRKLHYILEDTVQWADMMKVATVSELNDWVSHGKIDELIQVCEALHEKRIAWIADRICQDPRVQLIMIAGPSSSGKTSFAQRLSIQLKANGKKPMAVSMDNYFIDREKTPVDENGEYDFEDLEALQVDLFNQQMVQLLRGEEVQLPVYDFVQGKSLPNGPVMQLEKGQPLIIEGIHGLNEKLTSRVPREQKRLIYISALTQLNLNQSNSILTSDCRLLRRIARDARTRGNDVTETIRRWPSVRRGEKKNIFVYQENADYFFNSDLPYELAVIKPIVEPLLQSVSLEVPEAVQAQRLLRFLHYILPVENPRVPYQSLMREFIGGSWFDVE